MSTYLELTNLLLRRLLENELTSSEFASARSTQATAKDCVKDTVNEIYSKDKAWPFFYETGSQLLVVGQEEYALPVDCETPDWNSFRIASSDPLSTQTTPLKLISKEEWQKLYRPLDEDAGSDGRELPKFVFNSDTTAEPAFGVSPSPDQAYTVNFEYYKFVDELSAYDDTVLIPERYNWVIINGALKYFYSFKDNIEQTSLWETRFEKALSKMKTNLIDPQGDIRDTRRNYGGQNFKSVFYFE